MQKRINTGDPAESGANRRRGAGAVRGLLGLIALSSGVLPAQEASLEGLWDNTATAPDHPNWHISDQLWQGHVGPRVAYDEDNE